MEEKKKISNYKDLDVWQLSRKLVKMVYELTKQFPRDERFDLISQMRRAAISIPSNIAEGHGRPGRKDFANFLSIALGSLAELDTQIILSMDLEYITQNDSVEVMQVVQQLQRMLHKLYQAVEARNT